MEYIMLIFYFVILAFFIYNIALDIRILINKWKILGILDKDSKVFAEMLLEKAPKKFYEMPASITGKYHRVLNRLPGGILAHTYQAMKIGKHLCRMHGLSKKSEEKVLLALLIHDFVKYGDDNAINTYKSFKVHGPAIIGWTRRRFKNFKYVMDLAEIASAHNGRWSHPQFLPQTIEQKIVHEADYLSMYLKEAK